MGFRKIHEIYAKHFVYRYLELDFKHRTHLLNMILPDELLGVLGVNGGG